MKFVKFYLGYLKYVVLGLFLCVVFSLVVFGPMELIFYYKNCWFLLLYPLVNIPLFIYVMRRITGWP